MDVEVKTWLMDIRNAISEISSFLPASKDIDFLHDDLKTRRAIERNIEIIGEAMNRILKKQPEFPVSNARKIVDTRNRISHGYDTVSDQVIWTIITRDLILLGQEVDRLLE